MTQGNGFSAMPLWTNSHLGARFTMPVLKDGLLFGYNGHFFCANAQTGAKLREDDANRGNSAALVDVGAGSSGQPKPECVTILAIASRLRQFVLTIFGRQHAVVAPERIGYRKVLPKPFIGLFP